MSDARKIPCWHFISGDRMLAHQTPPMAVEPGFIYGEPEGEINICHFGMHGSRRIYDALGFAESSTLCQVRIWGDVQERGDKIVGRYREVLAIREVGAELRLWGCWCVRNTPISDCRAVWDLLTDPRSRNAVEVAERLARGEATREELAAAYGAGAAAWAAAWAARDAWDAAQAARDAARDAARNAAWAAWDARHAARDAAWAARDAARNAARAAVWAAARTARIAGVAAENASKFQADELERRMVALFAKGKKPAARQVAGPQAAPVVNAHAVKIDDDDIPF